MGELRTRKDYCLILDSKFDFSSKSCEIQFKGALDDIPPHLGFGTRTDVPRWKTTAFSVETLPEAQRTQKLTPRLGLNLATTWRHLH